MRARGYKIIVNGKVVDFIKIGKGGKSACYCKSIDRCVAIQELCPMANVESRLVSKKKNNLEVVDSFCLFW